MSEQPDSTAIELDPETLAEEHVVSEDPADVPEDYEPEPDLVSATREADHADVAEQLTEVPGMDEDGDEGEVAEEF
ncbi:hypothetical protein [Georgenia sp. SUBG003]|uniref:hypothetical protein n=1 Tax=Georgenia sp. SUBG003 TaxID=1497974 RepID=UPI0004D8B0F1|nr:hypothetical protein DA06_21200 [Georgenia sp. SUBG003]